MGMVLEYKVVAHWILRVIMLGNKNLIFGNTQAFSDVIVAFKSFLSCHEIIRDGIGIPRSCVINFVLVYMMGCHRQ